MSYAIDNAACMLYSVTLAYKESGNWYANTQHTDLQHTDLQYTDLQHTDLCCAAASRMTCACVCVCSRLEANYSHQQELDMVRKEAAPPHLDSQGCYSETIRRLVYANVVL